MSTEIKPLNLKVYNGTSDRKETFKRFTMDIAGDSDSNMTKISSWAEDVNSKIKDIDAIKDESSKLKVKDITTSVKDNTFNVIFSDDSTKEVYIKTVGGSSGELRVFKSSSSVPKSFTATEDVTQFNIEGLKETDEITLIFHGATMIKTDNYNTTYSNGICTVLLDFTLSKGETIWYLITETSYDYKDLSNAPRVVDNLETVTKGDALDASQGKELAKQIVNVDDKVGDLKDKALTIGRPIENINIRDFIANTNEPCMFWLNGTNVTGTPIEGKYYTGQLFIQPTGDKHVTLQEFNNNNTGKQYYGDMWNGNKDFEWVCDSDKITALQKRNYIQCADPNGQERDKATLPTDYRYKLRSMGLKNRTAMGLTGGGYVHPIGINSWTDESADVHELMFSFDGIYYRRSNSPTEWQAPKKLATTDKIDISLTPLGSLKITGNNVCRVRNEGGAYFLQLELQGTGTVGLNTAIISLPPEARPPSLTPFTAKLRTENINGWMYPNGSVSLTTNINTNDVLTVNTPI